MHRNWIKKQIHYFLFLLPRLGDGRLDKLSDIFNNMGTVLFATLVAQSVLTPPNLMLILVGLFGTISLWVLAIVIIKEN